MTEEEAHGRGSRPLGVREKELGFDEAAEERGFEELELKFGADHVTVFRKLCESSTSTGGQRPGTVFDR